jgi:hypothetical protein
LSQAKSQNVQLQELVRLQDLRVRSELQSEIEGMKNSLAEKETVCQASCIFPRVIQQAAIDFNSL